MTSIRVAHLHTSRDWGGGENQVLSLLRGLNARGVACVLFTPQAGELWWRAREAGIWTEPMEARPPMGSDMRRKVLDVTRELGITILHAHDSSGTSHGNWLARRLQVPLVLSRRIASPLRRNPLSRMKYSASRISAVLAISETVKRVFCSGGYPEEQVYVVPSGLDLDALDRVEPDEDARKSFGRQPLIGGIGKLSEKKNWMLMAETAHALNARGIDLKWVLLGAGPQEEALKNRISELGLDARFTMLGFRKDAATWLKTIDMLFFPSRMEGASVTVREAMALGTPVVAANAEGTMESLAGSGWIISPDDPDEAADAVCAVLDNHAEREKRVSMAREFAHKNYSLDRTVELTLEAYGRVLEPSADASPEEELEQNAKGEQSA